MKKFGLDFDAITIEIVLVVLLFAGFMYTGIVLFSYFYFVGGLSIGFSLDPQDWANFGSYVGGSLGTVFSLFALIALLITVSLQRQQLQDFNSRADIDELQRLLGATSDSLDRMLASPVTVDGMLTGLGGTFNKLLAHVGLPTRRDDGMFVLRIRRAFSREFSTDLTLFSVEIDRFSLVLSAYLDAGGSTKVRDIYTLRYEMYVVCLHELGEVGESSVTAQVFNLTELLARYSQSTAS